MNEKESLAIKKEFDDKLDQLIKLDKKEKNIKMTLIFSIFVLALFFSSFTAYIAIRNYKISQLYNNDEQIVNVKVQEIEE